MSMYREYPEELWNALLKSIDEELQKPGPKVAAFDADGTLWDCDVGENLFHYQIQNCELKLPEDPFQYYLDMKKLCPTEAYLWLAQINEGKQLEQVRNWAKKAVDLSTPPLLQPQKDLIDYLREKGIEVYVVTASIKWAVEPAAALYDIPFDRVIGVQSEVLRGKVQSKQEGVITYREGKAKAIYEATGAYPLLAVGNSIGDLELLESAAIALAVSAAKEEDAVYQSEMELQKEAEKKGWLQHLF